MDIISFFVHYIMAFCSLECSSDVMLNVLDTGHDGN